MKIVIYGYGNLGRGVECAAKQSPDAELVGIFTRRPLETVMSATGARVYRATDIMRFKGEIDVLIICGGSATDLPIMTPMLARHFNVVDSFDTHAKISEHLAAVDAAALEGGKAAVVCAGWDPGLFSVARLIFSAALPYGTDNTFWGRGVSQGHSDAIRRIDGVLDARQYTIPIPEAIATARSDQAHIIPPRQRHRRECYVVAKEGADLADIENKIKSMPDYFSDYDTTVTFITMNELIANHSDLPHGGLVIRTGKTGLSYQHSHALELSIRLDSNPEFTGSLLISVARALDKMAKRGVTGCKTMLDIPPADYSRDPRDRLIDSLL